MNILFSIIVPVYNVEKYLNECIDSILRQTYKGYEIIIVDDGSTDRSPDICDKYAEENDNIKTIHQKNGGQSCARNAGTMMASGKYLLFLDSDDFWSDEEYLMRLQYCIYTKKNPDLIMDLSYTSFADGCKNKKTVSELDEKINELDYDEAITIVFKSNYFPISAWSKIVKKNIIIDNKIYFKPDLICEDIDWSFKVLQSCETAYFNHFNNYCYRMREDSITHSLKEKTYLDLYSSINRWSSRLESLPDHKLKDCMLGYLAYEFYILLGIRKILGNFSEYKDALKKIQWVMNYPLNKKTRLCKILVNVLGIEKGAWVLAKYLERKV